MRRRSARGYFDLSTLFILGLAALLLVSLPGGCGDSDDEEAEDDISTESVGEPTPPALMEIVDPEPGDLDNVPAPGDDATDEDADQSPENEEESPQDESESFDGVYVVQSGDTLYGIAVQFNVSMDAIMAANDMDDPNQLQVGQELQIPN